MVDVVVASDNVVVVGGPSAIDVSIDVGPQGQRGSQIFTGAGQPQDVFLPDVQVNDLYINLKQSDLEYLYLYKYAGVNGQLAWSKVLRLVPNTVLTNPIVRFINGQAHTMFDTGTGVFVIRGLYFPLASLFPDGTLSISTNDLNVQHTVMSTLPVSSGIVLDSIGTEFEIDIWQPDNTYQTVIWDFGVSLIRGFISAKEDGTAISGFRNVNLLVTVGGRDTNAKYFYPADSVDPDTDTISYISHGMQTGARVIYLSNGNDAIGGLTDSSLYLVESVDSNTFALAEPTTPEIRLQIDPSTTSGEHTILRLVGLSG